MTERDARMRQRERRRIYIGIIRQAVFSTAAFTSDAHLKGTKDLLEDSKARAELMEVLGDILPRMPIEERIDAFETGAARLAAGLRYIARVQP